MSGQREQLAAGVKGMNKRFGDVLVWTGPAEWEVALNDTTRAMIGFDMCS